MLPTALKERVFEVLDRVQPQSRYKILVLDRRVKQLFDLVVDKAELLNRQVANVLNIEDRRPNEPRMECVYIVEHSSYSFACIQADFAHNTRKYAGVHVFLLRRLRSGDASLQRFSNSSINHSLRTIDYLPFSFLALENRIFTLGLPHANTILYNDACRELASELVDLTGREIANVCETLKMVPYIRYSNRWNASRLNEYPALVARAAAQHIEAMSGKFPDEDSEAATRPILLVLDRTVDITAPLRHEFGLQAMALDVLDQQFAPANTLRNFTSSDRSIPHEKEPKEVGEQDPNWVELRHKHIAIVTEELTERIRKLREANPHLADTASNVSVGDVRNMLAALPMFMKERESVGLNLDIAQECMAQVERLKLKDIAEFEQSVTLGTTSDGLHRPESLLADSFVTLMADRAIARDLKLRAFALYVVYRGGIRQTDYARMQHHARLADQDLDIIKALGYLGCPMIRHGESTEKAPPPLTSEHPDQPVLFSRVKTGLHATLEQLIAGSLSPSEYPYVGDTPDSTQEARSTATSLRNPKQRATWAQKVGAKSTQSAAESSRAKRRILVFMIGGFTASESQAIYNVSENSMFSVTLGGHDLLTPQKFMGFLSTINTAREELRLPEDQPDQPILNLNAAGTPHDEPENRVVSRSSKSPSSKPTSSTPLPVLKAPSPDHQQPARGLQPGQKTMQNEANKTVYRHTELRNIQNEQSGFSASSPYASEPPKKQKETTVKGKIKGALRFSKN